MEQPERLDSICRTSQRERVTRLRASMNQNSFDAVMIFSDENRRYLSNFTGIDGSYDESAGLLLITEKELILATDSRYKLQALNEAQLYSVYCYEKGLSAEIPEILQLVTSIKAGVGRYRIALETSRVTFDLYSKIKKRVEESFPDIDILSADDALKSFRIRKDQQEIDAIRASLQIAETAFLQLKKQIYEDMREREAAWLLEKLIRENGADSLSFPVIAASGTNSALPHAVPGDKRFKKHVPLLFDFGAKLNGYCSDISRTVVIGEPDNTFKEIYETLLNAQQKAVDAICPGIRCSDIDKIAREHIDNSKFNGRFGHALGHGVGIAIHEPPRLSRLDDTPLETGMVVTVEPGIYIPEWGGIRLENMIMVTEDGAEVLNTLGYDNYIL